MNFLVDMPLSPGLATWLRGQGHDAVHATEIGLAQAPDTEILACAEQGSRTIITADLDYPRLLALLHTIEPSLIVFRDGNWADAEVVARMSELLQSLAPADIAQVLLRSNDIVCADANYPSIDKGGSSLVM